MRYGTSSHAAIPLASAVAENTCCPDDDAPAKMKVSDEHY